ncbi:MAG: GNAT family N-acetyltransferase [Flavobacteriaceae bacterium]|nr:GNAT family N-acetyltransferase [Flavobacteriaceae bacterium]
MNHDFLIRHARLDDSKKLSILYKQVYIQTYGKEGVSDEFANFITEQFSIERLENIIATIPDAIMVAEYKNNLVGVLEIDFEKPCPIGDFVAPELNKIYILEWFCGKGIGKLLVKKAEHVLKQRGYDRVWLWLLESNTRAYNFYKKSNYIDLGKAPFVMEDNTYTNLVMSKRL